MPFIDTKLNFSISKERETALKAKLGEAISLLPGKSERWLMLNFQENCRLWFAGKNDAPMAMVEVEIFGKASPADCDALTARICDLFAAELGIAPDHVYINYTFSTAWGWNGSNF